MSLACLFKCSLFNIVVYGSLICKFLMNLKNGLLAGKGGGRCPQPQKGANPECTVLPPPILHVNHCPLLLVMTHLLMRWYIIVSRAFGSC